MKTLIIFALITAVLLWYAVQGREWLKSKPWAAGFFAWVEPIEILLFRKSETILVARLKMLAGVLLTCLTQIGTIDLTPIMPFVPDKYKGPAQIAFNLLPMLLTVLGWIDEKLRNMTTAPVEVVAAPINAPPAVKAAIAQANIAKVQAITAIEVAKVSS